MIKRFAKFFLKLISFGVLALVIFIVTVYSGYFGAIPDQDRLKNIRNNLATEIYSADGKVITRFYLQERRHANFEDISKDIVNALVATEDARFYKHNGVDFRSTLRVLFKTILTLDKRSGGGSTLSQQLAKNLFQREDHGILSIPVNKIKEALTAYRLESLFGKEEILTLYLNTVPFGDNVYGISMAASRFYSKPPSEITTKEAAVLVGMLKANHYYNPRLYPAHALSRRNTVLRQMVKYDYLKSIEYDSLSGLPITLNYNAPKESISQTGYLKELVRKQIVQWASENTDKNGDPYNIYIDGLKVYTTIDSRIQKYAETSVREHMSSLQKSFDEHWRNSKPWTKNPDLLQKAIKNSQAYKNLKAKGLTEEKINETLKKKHPVRLFSWQGDKEVNISSLDSIKYYLNILQTGVIAMNPNNGAIKAWVGGIDFNHFQFDHARESTKRQVGSTFKPFVYALALEEGMNPCKYRSAGVTHYANLDDWTPDNADKEENKYKYSFKGALAKSVNTVTIQLIEDVSIENTIELAERCGINSELPEVPSVALGTGSISLFEMVRSYAVFANGGHTVEPQLITRIEDQQGNVIYEADEARQTEAVLKHETALVMNHLLQSVVNEGTAISIRSKYGIKGDLAGKTGTTQSNADGWFIGYNPELVIGVWVGADNPGVRFRTTRLGSGASTALPIFAKTFKKINIDPQLKHITQSRFPALPDKLTNRLDCVGFKEDKNIFQKVLGLEKKEKVKTKNYNDSSKSFFEKVGSIFKKKKTKAREN